MRAKSGHRPRARMGSKDVKQKEETEKTLDRNRRRKSTKKTNTFTPTSSDDNQNGADKSGFPAQLLPVEDVRR